MSQVSIQQTPIKLPLIIGEAYTDQKRVIRRISWVDGIWVFYEVLSAELRNGTGNRIGYSVDGNPIYKCSAVAFRNWAKQIVPMDIIPLSPDAVPINLLGKLFKGRDGIVRWLCPSMELSLFCTLWQMDSGVWAYGWRGLFKPWVGSETLGEAPDGAEYQVVENGNSVTRVIQQVHIRHEKTIV